MVHTSGFGLLVHISGCYRYNEVLVLMLVRTYLAENVSYIGPQRLTGANVGDSRKQRHSAPPSIVVAVPCRG